jgi:hypothetical protein
MSHPADHETDKEATVNNQGMRNGRKGEDQKMDGRGWINPVLISKQSQ